MDDGFHQHITALVDNIRRVVVAKPEVVRLAVLGLVCQGHILLDDYPGVGKTLLAKALAQSLCGTFKRIQFTPDLLPSDITGSSIYHPGTSAFQFVPGPVFSNLVLADEVNRASPRTQSALLEAMGEGQVTFDGVAHVLPRPFLVIATRNLAERHGVFPLPHAQLDRFLLSMSIGYPGLEQEVEILERHEHLQAQLGPVLTVEDVLWLQEQISLVSVARPVKEYIAAIGARTREAPGVALGLSPRGVVQLQRATQGWAALEGRRFATPDDVKAVAVPVLRHQIVPRASQPEAVVQVIETILGGIPIPL